MRLLCAVVLAGVLMGGSAALWVLDHQRLRHDYFATRHATAGAVTAVRDASAASQGVGEAFKITAANGLAVRLRVLRSQATNAPRPLVVVLGGYGTGRDAVRLVGDPGEFAVVAMDYPYDGPDRIHGWAQALYHWPALQQALLDTPPALSIVLDWLQAQPWVDPAQIELIGVSFGAPFVAAAGALDQRFTRVWIIDGGADNRAWIEHNLRKKLPQPWLRRAVARLVHTLAYGTSLDTAWWVARISPRRVVIVGATDDERLPRELVQRLYDAANEPKELVWIEGGHVDAGRPETLRPVLEIVWGRLRAERR